MSGEQSHRIGEWGGHGGGHLTGGPGPAQLPEASQLTSLHLARARHTVTIMEADKNGGHNGPGPAPAKPDPQEHQHLLQPGVLYVFVSLVIK